MQVLEVNKQIVEEFLAPILAAQIFLFVLIYFTLVKRRIASNYKLYVYFLIAFIVFLVTRPVQLGKFYPYMVYYRMGLMFIIVLPSLTLAVLGHYGVQRNRKWIFGTFGAGAVFAGTYILFTALKEQEWMLNGKTDIWYVFRESANTVQIIAAFAFLIIPCSILLFQEYRSSRRSSLLIFLVSTLLFGGLLAFGTMQEQFGLYYLGSVIFALCWSWVVYKDIHDLKGKVTLLKEELQYLVQSGPKSVAPEIEGLLVDLEELSNGNMAVYKMRVRAILNMLTELKIQAGGDSEILVLQNQSLINEINALSDPNEMRQILRSEAVEVSEIISDKAGKPSSAFVQQAKEYIESNFTDDIGVQQIAESLGMSEAHLMREFKKITGKTMNQYLTSVRMEYAKKLLGQKSVTETAFEVGYNSSSYFSKVFKKHTGISPADFKASV